MQNSIPVAASEKRVLIQFDEEIHCEIVNRDDEKRTSIENVVRNIINKNVEVVGVPSDQWMRVRTEYINSRKQTIKKKIKRHLMKEKNNKTLM